MVFEVESSVFRWRFGAAAPPRHREDCRDKTSNRGAALRPSPPAEPTPSARRIDPKYTPIPVSTVTAVVMSFTMSLFQRVVRIGLVPGLLSARLTSFAIGLVVSIPTAIVAAPRAQRLARYFTGDPRRPKDG
jgi:Protein of unknown function (DUF2798)